MVKTLSHPRLFSGLTGFFFIFLCLIFRIRQVKELGAADQPDEAGIREAVAVREDAENSGMSVFKHQPRDSYSSV